MPPQVVVCSSSSECIMSAAFFTELRNGVNSRDSNIDDKMDQIRELLYGEFKRDSDARIALIEARVRELESGLHRKLDAIQAQIGALSSSVKSDQSATFDELSRSVLELGERIRHIPRG